MLAIHTPGGIGRYARILGATLLTRFDGELHLFLESRADISRILCELPESISSGFTLKPNHSLHFSKAPVMPRYAIHLMEIGHAFAGLKLDAYLDPDYMLPALPDVQCSCVVQDITPFAMPNLLGTKARLIYAMSALPALLKSHRLIVSSQHTADALSALFPQYSEKMRVVEPCLSPVLAEASASAYQPRSSILLETEFGEIRLPQPFILHIGVPGPRKNTSALIKAFKEAKLRMFPHRLVFVGGKAKKLPAKGDAVPQVAYSNGAVAEQIPELPEVLYLGRVSENDLISLYRHADLLALPSIEEGFGYPVLEALAFRTPALVSNGSPLSHLPGVAIIQEPGDYLSIAQDLEDTLRGLPSLSAAISSSFSLSHYQCERYLDELLAALAE
jgi:glycosyltransferase involved in cell wall biosynthesis